MRLSILFISLSIYIYFLHLLKVLKACNFALVHHKVGPRVYSSDITAESRDNKSYKNSWPWLDSFQKLPLTSFERVGFVLLHCEITVKVKGSLTHFCSWIHSALLLLLFWPFSVNLEFIKVQD